MSLSLNLHGFKQVNARDSMDSTALFYCLYDGDVDVAEKLLCHRADPCLKGPLVPAER